MYEGLTIALIILGIGAIFWSFYKDQGDLPTSKRAKAENEQEQYEEYGARINELNGKILELNEYSEFMKSELDKKHKELLFLYQLINEKSKEIKGQSEEVIHVTEKESISIIPPPENIKLVDKAEQQKLNHNKMILQLSERGYSIKDIAQMLEIGQGEVKLVLNLFE